MICPHCGTPIAALAVPREPDPPEMRDWLIYDGRSECYWGPNKGGYWKSIEHAGLYTEAEAKAAEAFAQRYDRREQAVHISEHREAIERLAAALAVRPVPLRQTVEDPGAPLIPGRNPREVEITIQAVPTPTCPSCATLTPSGGLCPSCLRYNEHTE